MRNLPLHLVLALCLVACQNEQTGTTTENATATNTENIITDSLTQLYQGYMQNMKDVYPPKCITERAKLNPADEAPTDTLFFLFRETFKKAISDRDIFALLPHVSPQIKTGLGADGGLQSFIQMWELDSPEKIPQSRLWPTLESVLSLGGQFHNYGTSSYFEAPYLGPCWPGDTDHFEYGAVIGAGVRLRAGPNLNTQILKNLSYDLVKYIETTPIEATIGGESHPWIKVELNDGTVGFLYGKFYRSPLDFRAGFQQDEAKAWKLVSLLAGD